MASTALMGQMRTRLARPNLLESATTITRLAALRIWFCMEISPSRWSVRPATGSMPVTVKNKMSTCT